MNRWSKTAERALRDAGWFPGREIDISSYEESLSRAGYPVFDAVKRFLREFGGLRVKSICSRPRSPETARHYPVEQRLSKYELLLAIDPIEVVEYVWDIEVKDILGPSAGCELCPVAVYRQSYDRQWLMDQRGSFYAADGSGANWLRKLADNSIRALECFCLDEMPSDGQIPIRHPEADLQ